MSFPDLVPFPNSSGVRVFHSSAQGAATNGNNTFDLGFDLSGLHDPDLDDWITVRAWALLGSGVTGATFVGRVGNKVTVNFVGAGQCFVEAEYTHSLVR